MSALLNNEGRLDQLSALLAALGANLKLSLFTAPTTNSKTNPLGAYTEATFAGYAAVAPAWGAPSLDGNGNAVAVATAVTFTSTGASPTNTLYGYYLYDALTNKVWWSELFSAPIMINASGQSVTVTPSAYLGDCQTPL